MANVLGLYGYNSPNVNTIFGFYGNTVVYPGNSSQGGETINLTPGNDVFVDQFKSYLLATNYANKPIYLNDNTNWIINTFCMVRSKYIKQWNGRFYQGYCKHPRSNSLLWPNKIFYTDYVDEVPYTLGASSRTILKLTTGFATEDVPTGAEDNSVIGKHNFHSYNAYFKSRGIKSGDPLYLTQTSQDGKYTILSVDSEHDVTILENFTTIESTGGTWWAGSNWFDVPDNNGDYVTGFAENSNRLLVFQNRALYRYDEQSLIRVRGSVGTTSPKSIGNIRDVTIFFYGDNQNKTKTGFYLYDGATTTKISHPVEPYMQAIATSNYDDVVFWAEGDVYRAYIGNLSLSNSSNPEYNISRTNAVFSYNVTNQRISIDSIYDIITCSTPYINNGVTETYLGTSEGKVILAQNGNSFRGNPIPYRVATKPIYPTTSDGINDFDRITIVSRDARGVQVNYKLWGTPNDVDTKWTPLGTINKEFTEMRIPNTHNQARGIQFEFKETSSNEPSFYIEKVTIFSNLNTITETKDIK